MKFKLSSREKEILQLVADGLTNNEISSALPDTSGESSPVVYNNQVIYQRTYSGFLAQEVKEVFPDLVTTDEKGMMSINYIRLIPYLVEAMKEQQTEIEILQNLVEDQELEIIKIKEHIGLLPPPDSKKSAEEETDPGTGDTPVLYQNNPNPFNITTEIILYLPGNVKKALLYVHDLHGAEIKVFDIRERGQVKTEIHANTLNKGMYLYSLVVDGKQVDSKRMILTD